MSSKVSEGGSVKVLSSLLVFTLISSGCSSLIQVPRSQFAAAPVRKNVLIRTESGQQYAFDRVSVTADSLFGTGYQQRLVVRSDGESQMDEVSTDVRLPLANITSLSEKKRDWKRTTKWGVGALAASAFVVAVGTSKGNSDTAGPGPGKGPPIF
jgi:hypothetical protein